MMDKPPWINEVKEIDREEAIVLLNLGVPVYQDCARRDGRTDWCYYKNMVDQVDLESEVMKPDPRYIDIFFVLPGEPNESTS